jgi:hypothetical protein
MARPHTLWIAIADGEHARFAQPDGDNRLRIVRSLDSASAHLRSRDLGSDRPGRSFESATTAHHAVGEKHDPHRSPSSSTRPRRAMSSTNCCWSRRRT